MRDEAIRMMMGRVWISETKIEFGGGCSTEDSESQAEEVGVCCSVCPSFYAILRSENMSDRLAHSHSRDKENRNPQSYVRRYCLIP